MHLWNKNGGSSLEIFSYPRLKTPLSHQWARHFATMVTGTSNAEHASSMFGYLGIYSGYESINQLQKWYSNILSQGRSWIKYMTPLWRNRPQQGHWKRWLATAVLRSVCWGSFFTIKDYRKLSAPTNFLIICQWTNPIAGKINMVEKMGVTTLVLEIITSLYNASTVGKTLYFTLCTKQRPHERPG